MDADRRLIVAKVRSFACEALRGSFRSLPIAVQSIEGSDCSASELEGSRMFVGAKSPPDKSLSIARIASRLE